MSDAQDAEDRLDTLARLEAATEAGMMSYSGPVSAWVNQAIDEAESHTFEAALVDYPLLWWALQPRGCWPA